MVTPLYHDKITASGYTGDEMLSALQKLIRRGETESAFRAAYELSLLGEEQDAKAWQRLSVICAEDIGMANPTLPAVIHALSESAKALPFGDPDRYILMAQAVRVLCESKKDRSTCTLCSVVKRRIRNNVPFTLPDYVYDMHTVKGQALGRGYEHFLTEACRLHPEAEQKDPWMDEYKKDLETENHA